MLYFTRHQVLFVFFLIHSAFSLTACMPEPLHAPTTRLWSDADVDAIVQWEKVRIFSPLPSEQQLLAPDDCNYISFLRIKIKSAPVNSSGADAIFMMMPGILEGATAFKYIGRQMAYIAKTQHNKNFEIWGVDRRGNCIEDRTIADDIESAASATDAGLMMIDYYFKQTPINGNQFAGFHTSDQVPFLSEFGLRLATQDMFTIMQTMMPNLTDRQNKLFVGGHSLGGIHTSVFLSWDLDGNPTTIDDAGYNNVAGTFAFDSILSSVDDIPKLINSALPFGIGFLGVAVAESVSPQLYQSVLKALREGKIPRFVAIPDFFDPSVISFPTLLAAITQHNPKEENFITKQIEPLLTPALSNIMDFLHPSTTQEGNPRLTDFRYTNEALLSLFFDDDFSPIKFLGISLGQLHGGGLQAKPSPSGLLSFIPFVKNFVNSQLEVSTQYVATQSNLNQDAPLYTWGNFDAVATTTDPKYSNLLGQVLTTATEELVDINDFVNSVYDPVTNLDLTEWYFSTRLMLDIILAAPFHHAIESGLNVWHRSKTQQVPAIEFIAQNGILPPISELNVVPFSNNVILLEGRNHLDPMFEVVNAPDRHTPVVIPMLIDFALAHIQQE